MEYMQIKAEGEKVAKGEAIFRYYSNKEDNLTKKIEELDTKIDEQWPIKVLYLRAI